ncbi:MarR family transcriptional regulator [Caulobacter sp. Root1455]|uniref:MarR family winged helix-turn-helix transcriptional regulator n=1 Tax=Caulobacter sp. Root1455 TaxID=1736465 RepID=UPI0006FBE5E2|nr:MarR family transcriptional regulator [Caulobacter sp. Root1455]KQY96132.1 MarR family transcriptional regulator [Caulobacter sp. Root1455]
MVDLDNPAPTDDLHAEIEQFYFAYRGFTDRADRILDKRGLGRVHHRILYFIGRRPDVSVRGLLDLLAVSKQALNAPLRQLMEMGLVGAEAGAQDRRVKNLRLTSQGRKLEAELTEAQTRHLRAAFDRAGAEAQRGWSAVMGELVKG